MSFAKRQQATDFNAYQIGDDNPLVGSEVTVTWLRNWGGHSAGYAVTGKLLKTFSVHGRTLIGELLGYGDDLPVCCSPRRYSAPWSRNYIKIEQLGG